MPVAREGEAAPFDVVRRQIVRDVDERAVRSAGRDHPLQLADISVGRAEIAQQRDDARHAPGVQAIAFRFHRPARQMSIIPTARASAVSEIVHHNPAIP